MNPPNTIASDTLVEAIARAIEPYAFRQHELMVAHCLNSGDAPDVARRYADMTYGQNIDDARSDAQAALTAITEAGYVIVPREPDDAMICAGIIERHDQPTPEAWSLATASIYRAMINAAQAPHIMPPPMRDSGPLESEEGE